MQIFEYISELALLLKCMSESERLLEQSMFVLFSPLLFLCIAGTLNPSARLPDVSLDGK